MIFALRLHARSGRWIPPALVLIVWVALVVANPESALDNAANLFFAVLVASVWWTSAIGNVDDDPHRDLCAAQSGGPARLAALRHIGVLVALLPVVVVVGALSIATGSGGDTSATAIVAGTAGLLVSGVLLGVTVGGFLHRPVLRSTAWTVLLALVALLVIALVPPTRDVLHDVDHGRLGSVGVLLVVAAAVALGGGWSASALAARRS